jgi:flagellar operon protein
MQQLTPVRSLNRTKQNSKETLQPDVFSAYLQNALTDTADAKALKISKHAGERLQERGIQLDSSTWEEIGEKVSEARQKGLNEMLVLVKDAALIVSAKNSTVITAMDRHEAGARIFSNINGAIIMES